MHVINMCVIGLSSQQEHDLHRSMTCKLSWSSMLHENSYYLNMKTKISMCVLELEFRIKLMLVNYENANNMHACLQTLEGESCQAVLNNGMNFFFSFQMTTQNQAHKNAIYRAIINYEATAVQFQYFVVWGIDL